MTGGRLEVGYPHGIPFFMVLPLGEIEVSDFISASTKAN